MAFAGFGFMVVFRGLRFIGEKRKGTVQSSIPSRRFSVMPERYPGMIGEP
jgi:hypothetical protein